MGISSEDFSLVLWTLYLRDLTEISLIQYRLYNNLSFFKLKILRSNVNIIYFIIGLVRTETLMLVRAIGIKCSIWNHVLDMPISLSTILLKRFVVYLAHLEFI